MLKSLWRRLLRWRNRPAAERLERTERRLHEIRREAESIQERIGPLGRMLLEIDRQQQRQGEKHGGDQQQ